MGKRSAVASSPRRRLSPSIGRNVDLLRRATEGRGLTRPELAVLLATAKLALQDEI